MTTAVLLVPLVPLATVGQLQEFTGSDALPRDVAELILASASALVRRYCGWHIFPVITETGRVVNARGGSILGLPTLCLLDLGAVAIKAAVTNEWVDLTVDEVAALDWAQDGWVERTSGWYSGGGGVNWPNRPRSVRVTMRHGFADASDVQQLVLTIAARAIAAPAGAVSQTVGAVSLSFGPGPAGGPAGGTTLFPDQRELLDSYRLFGRP